jgi:hypothetical protein
VFDDFILTVNLSYLLPPPDERELLLPDERELLLPPE